MIFIFRFIGEGLIARSSVRERTLCVVCESITEVIFYGLVLNEIVGRSERYLIEITRLSSAEVEGQITRRMQRVDNGKTKGIATRSTKTGSPRRMEYPVVASNSRRFCSESPLFLLKIGIALSEMY